MYSVRNRKKIYAKKTKQNKKQTKKQPEKERTPLVSFFLSFFLLLGMHDSNADVSEKLQFRDLHAESEVCVHLAQFSFI